MEYKEFLGTTTELLTPFLSDMSLDYAAWEKEIKFQVEEGISGIFVNGLASETLMLDFEERVKLLELTVKIAKGKVPIMANIAEDSSISAIKLLKKYEDEGADAICITQPMVYAYTKDALYNFYSKLISETQLPVYIYNAPQSSNILPPDLVARLINENDNVKGYKDSTQDIIHLQTLMSLVNRENSFEFISGSDATILPTLLLGGVGVISLVSAVFPKLVSGLCSAYFAGDIERAKSIQFQVLKVRDILKCAPPTASGYKYALSLRLDGFPEGYSRLPMWNANDNQRKMIKDGLEKLGLY